MTNKTASYIALLCIIAFFFLLPLFHSGFYLTHDGEAHVARFAAYFSAFRDGQFPPRWGGNLNSGYGSPLFIFFYPLPGAIASLLHLSTLDFETVFTLMTFLSFTLAPVFLFLWLKRSATAEIALLAAVAYLLLPYRFLDSLVRGDIGELTSFVFMPLVFLCIDKVQTEKKILPILMGGVMYTLLILSHNAIAIIFSPVFVLYTIVFAKKRNEIFLSWGIFIVGMVLSAYFWIPAFAEAKYVYVNLLVVKIYKDNFIPLLQLFYSPWGFGVDVNHKGSLSPQIGILYTTITFIAAGVLLKIKKNKELFFWLIIFAGAAFMTTNFSAFLWQPLPVIKLMGYPWRFTALSGFAACMLFFYLLKFVHQKYYWLIFFIILFSALPFVRVKAYVPKKSDAFYFAYQGTTDYHMRTTTRWVAGDFGQTAKKHIDIIAGKGKITHQTRKSNLHTFHVDASTPVAILDNTVFFPGWRVAIDGKRVRIQFQDENHRGLITFLVPAGSHDVRVKFFESRIRFFADMVSLVGLALVVVLACFFRWRR